MEIHGWTRCLLLAALAGLIAVALGQPWGDPVAGLAVTAFICLVGYEVTKDVVRRLADGVDPEMITTAEAAAGTVPGVIHAHAPRARVSNLVSRPQKEAPCYTVAGTGSPLPDSGDGVQPARAELGYVKTEAGQFDFSGVAAGSLSDVYLSDTPDNLVRMIAGRTGTFFGRRMRAGDIYTIAGGGTTLPVNGTPAIQARIGVIGLSVDRQGNVLMSDLAASFSAVWVLPARSGTYYGQQMTADDLYLVAGGGNTPGDGIPAIGAALPFDFTGVATDKAGNIVLAGDSVRIVAARTGTFYGQSMTAGHLCTIAGGGTGLIPDNRPGTKIALDAPEGLAVLPSGDIVFSDLGARPRPAHPPLKSTSTAYYDQRAATWITPATAVMRR